MCYHSERLSNPIPPQWTQACIRLFSQDNVSSLLHVETNTQPRVLAPSIYLAPLEPWRWVGRRGNNFSVIIVITSAPYHCGCLSKKSCIGVVLHEDDAVTPPTQSSYKLLYDDLHVHVLKPLRCALHGLTNHTNCLTMSWHSRRQRISGDIMQRKWIVVAAALHFQIFFFCVR